MSPRAGLKVLDKRKVFVPIRIRTPNRPDSGTDAILNMLPRLPKVQPSCSLIFGQKTGTLNREVGGPHSQSGRFGEKSFLPTRTRTPYHPPSGTDATPIKLPRLQKFISRPGYKGLALATLSPGK